MKALIRIALVVAVVSYMVLTYPLGITTNTVYLMDAMVGMASYFVWTMAGRV